MSCAHTKASSSSKDFAILTIFSATCTFAVFFCPYLERFLPNLGLTHPDEENSTEPSVSDDVNYGRDLDLFTTLLSSAIYITYI